MMPRINHTYMEFFLLGDTCESFKAPPELLRIYILISSMEGTLSSRKISAGLKSYFPPKSVQKSLSLFSTSGKTVARPNLFLAMLNTKYSAWDFSKGGQFAPNHMYIFPPFSRQKASSPLRELPVRAT